MNLLRLLGRLGPGPLRRLVLYAAASALSSTLVLAIVNRAAERIAEDKADIVDVPMALAFVASVLVYMVVESRMVAHMASDVEEVVDELRMGLLDRIRRADLWKLERFGQTPLFESVTQSSQIISQNSQFLALTLRSVLLTGTILVYIATVSPTAFLLIGGLLGGGAWFYVRLGRALDERQGAMMAEEAVMFEGVSDLFDGFKEQRLNSARSQDLNATFGTVSARTTAARDQVHLHSWQQFVFGECAFNLMLGVVVFVVPTYSGTFAQEVVKVSAAVFFLATPVFGLMQSLAVTSAAEAAAGRMMDLEKQLAELAEPGSDGPGLPVPKDFAEWRMEGVEFAFPAPPGEPPFAVGPFDLTIRRGEVIFVTGGNGSGKSTFIKLLTGLYHPLRGRLTLDDAAIGPQRIAAYRELMATVFADFHLFARLYGLDPVDRVKAEDLMRWMEMERVTAVEGDRFGRRDLSMGQRKRLGLVAAILETKPILILDEWAADQDPHFRFKFYREVVPALKARGLTIVAVTHDDHYFDVADRRLHMEEGRLTELTVTEGAA
ncbi:ATP-binding cassette domain-containing protein [Azospirillum rugosum]|uniref:ATP-binding cassette transporter n=1 Tax=Azospirillum rugosum TaxID=416170 RepID=A0ABS4SFF8_9PROT|nr:ATP-binding cassette domain-containing protein [Azospirillum rugosum]MBP2291309.1 putative ATP-binding cassette transporter [Azospirillum rugosum]MDQ0525097.1 putative ATP-binding cassette transporter [Azospirillum rugosum]